MCDFAKVCDGYSVKLHPYESYHGYALAKYLGLPTVGVQVGVYQCGCSDVL